ncbi:MAG TPA: hypothetical protein VLG74_09110 [Blastocatellia bacterium]|nr:hypothetical protein [Blastocatellia bacterium]
MRVTVILDSGGFLIDDDASTGPLDVGYFQSAGTHDIEVSEDGRPAQGLPRKRLGKGNKRIDVQHVAAAGAGIKTGVDQKRSFKKDLLKKNELYPNDTPDFNPKAYDCILRFHSGDFESTDVRNRLFKEHRLSDDGPTGNSHPTRAIANDVLVHFDLADGEELRLRRASGRDLWSSSSVSSGTKKVEVKLLADASLDTKYFRKALKHKGPNYHRPNPDPPPMNGNRGTG